MTTRPEEDHRRLLDENEEAGIEMSSPSTDAHAAHTAHTQEHERAPGSAEEGEHDAFDVSRIHPL